MEGNDGLYADEVLSDSQEGKEVTLTPEEVERTLAQIEAESLVSSLGVKRKREQEEPVSFCEVAKSGRRKGRKALMCSYEGSDRTKQLKTEPKGGNPQQSENPKVFSIEKISLPESCSLFNTISLSWSVSTALKFVGVNSSHFSFVPQPSKKIKNGIWLKWNVVGSGEEALGKDLYLLIELYERHINSSNDLGHKDQPVAFCTGKCGQKKTEVISLQEKKVNCNDHGVFEAIIAINEQCAHRSDNEYGSPNTRFYFRLQLCEKVVEVGGGAKMVALACAESSLIKVVAPGKSKLPAKATSKKAAAAKVSSKMTMKQMMETFLITLQGFDERLQSLERKLEERPTSIKEEVKVEELPDPGTIEYPSIHDDSTTSFKRESRALGLRQSCEFSLAQEEDFLSLSQEAHLMMPEIVLSP